MLYYIVMADRNTFSKEKPIEDVKQSIKAIETDIKFIKEYIRKIEIRKQLEEDKQKQIEDEYVKPTTGWFW